MIARHITIDSERILKTPYPSPPLIAWDAPIKTVSEANAHAHWRLRSARAKTHRTAAHYATRANLAHLTRAGAELVTNGLLVTLTRIAPSSGLDTDNLASSQKHIRDGIADALGIDDRDERVTWRYAQERGKHYHVRCTIERRPKPMTPAARLEWVFLALKKRLITKKQARQLLELA